MSFFSGWGKGHGKPTQSYQGALPGKSIEVWISENAWSGCRTACAEQEQHYVRLCSSTASNTTLLTHKELNKCFLSSNILLDPRIEVTKCLKCSKLQACWSHRGPPYTYLLQHFLTTPTSFCLLAPLWGSSWPCEHLQKRAYIFSSLWPEYLYVGLP